MVGPFSLLEIVGNQTMHYMLAGHVPGGRQCKV